MNQDVVVTIIVQSVAFGVGIFKIYSDMQLKLKELDIRLSAVEKQDDEIYQKLEKIAESVNDIKLQLKDKANK
jgi:hypothetical protein